MKNTNALYTQAKAEKQQDEAIKALLYRLALEPQVTETDVNKQIASISEEIAAAGDEAEAAVLNTILAAVYEDFSTITPTVSTTGPQQKIRQSGC